VQDVEKLGALTLRRSGRIPKEIAILVIGCDAVGKGFMEETKTAVVSRFGAGIVSSHKLCVEQEMILVHVESNKEAEIRIVGQIGSAGGSYTYGVAFLNPDLDFWGIEFPPAARLERSEGSMALQCNSCGCREVIAAGALELDICAIHGEIVRDCKRCKHSTLWTQPSGSVPDSPALSEVAPTLPDPAIPSGTGPAPVKNRRKHARVNVNFNACVRNPGSEDAIALCENVSRGGLCFKSSQRYYETARIEVAAPYSPGSHCILVPAQIVYVKELPEEGMFRYGVQYFGPANDARV
jgi:hypothetical protein